LELRASFALPKGTELLYAYRDSQQVLQGRRETLRDAFGFVCRCEMCTLPTRASLLLDTKIRAARDNLHYLMLFLGGDLGLKADIFRAFQAFEDFMSFIIEERLFRPNNLILPLFVFASINDWESFQAVGAKVLLISERCYGPDSYGPEAGSVSAISCMLEDPHRYIYTCGRFQITADNETNMNGLRARFRKTAVAVLSSLQKLL
jgi:hypothetical protein